MRKEKKEKKVTTGHHAIVGDSWETARSPEREGV